jgi:hypothetical protein
VRLAITLLRVASMQGDHHAEHETRERGLPCGHDTARRYIMVDPTAIETDFDPTVQRMRGVALHGGMPFDVPIISEIGPNLWQGGRV